MAASFELRSAIEAALARITECWRSGHPQRMAALLDPDIVMVLPEFSGRVTGRDALIESFVQFGREASVLEYQEQELHVDGTSDTAVAQLRFSMVCERDSSRLRSTGWDVWVFQRQPAGWTAVWRTMQAVREERLNYES